MTLKVPTRLTRIGTLEEIEGMWSVLPEHFGGRTDACGVHDAMQRAECAHGKVHRALDVLLARDVRLSESRLGAERLLRGGAGLGIHIQDDGAATGLEDALDRRAPQPGRTAGDNETLS